MDGEGRMENVRGAFEPCARARAGLLVGLVDDVSTTGATIAACGRALKEGGARSVWGSSSPVRFAAVESGHFCLDLISSPG